METVGILDTVGEMMQSPVMQKSRIMFVGSGLLRVILLSRISHAAQKQTKLVDKPDGVHVGPPFDVIAIMLKMARMGKADMAYYPGCDADRIPTRAAQNYGCRRFWIPDRSCGCRGFKKDFSSKLRLLRENSVLYTCP